MQIQLTPEQSSQFAQLAALAGRDAHEMAQAALGSYLDYETRYIAGVLEAEEEIARGEFYTSDQVRAHFARYLTKP